MLFKAALKQRFNQWQYYIRTIAMSNNTINRKMKNQGFDLNLVEHL